MKRILPFVALLFAFLSPPARAQTTVFTISVTTSSTAITTTATAQYVTIRENSASPSISYSIVLPGSNISQTYAAGVTYQFVAPSGTPFPKGTIIGYITGSGSGTFLAAQNVGLPPSGSTPQKNTTGGGGSSITLQTNGTNNGSQSVLNLAQGSGIDVVDGGTGTVTISLAGDPPPCVSPSTNMLQYGVSSSVFGCVLGSAVDPTTGDVALAPISGIGLTITGDSGFSAPLALLYNGQSQGIFFFPSDFVTGDIDMESTNYVNSAFSTYGPGFIYMTPGTGTSVAMTVTGGASVDIADIHQNSGAEVFTLNATGDLALTPSAGAALTVTGASDASDGIDVTTSGGGVAVNTQLGTVTAAFRSIASNFTGQGELVDNAGVGNAGIVGVKIESVQLAGSNVANDYAIGAFLSAQDASSGGVAQLVEGADIGAICATNTAHCYGVEISYGGFTATTMAGLEVDAQGGNPAIDTDPGDPSYLGAGTQVISEIGGTALTGSNQSTNVTSIAVNGTTNITDNEGSVIFGTGLYGEVSTNGDSVNGDTFYGVRGLIFGDANAGAAAEESAFFAQADCDNSGAATTLCNGFHIQAVTGGATNTGILIDNLGNANNAITTGTGVVNFGDHINQTSGTPFAGVCSMSTSTSCSFNVANGYNSTPICIATVQGTDITVGAVSCGVSGTTVTITAAVANSDQFAALLIGNPN